MWYLVEEDLELPFPGGEIWEPPSPSIFQLTLNASNEQDTTAVYGEMPLIQEGASSEATSQGDMDTASDVQWRGNIRKSSEKAEDEMVEQNLLSQDETRMEKESHTEQKTDESIIPQRGFLTELEELADNRDASRAPTEENTIHNAESGGISSDSWKNRNSPACPEELKGFTCSECGKSFRYQSHFANHQRIHTGEKPYKCADCGKSFCRKDNLTTHARIHTGEKPFKCFLCKKSFTGSSDLTVHERTHTGEKPFKCCVCKKCFFSNSNLTVHQRTHTGEKPFQCSVCNKCFAHMLSLKKHQRIHKGETTHEC